MKFSANISVFPEIAALLNAYFELLESALPDRITGFYLTGSLALNDYQPGKSDLDFVAVGDFPFTKPELLALETIHAGLAARDLKPELDGIYVTGLELRNSPLPVSAPYWLGNHFHESGAFNANPVTWHTLRHHPLAIRGPRHPKIHADGPELRRWCRKNLTDYWSLWIRRAEQNIQGLSAQDISWGVTGITRLHATIDTGEIISKSQAAEYALRHFPPELSPILETARKIRQTYGQLPLTDPIRSGEQALRLMKFALASALRIKIC